MKSKRTRALEIPKKVKLIVYKRQEGKCLFCPSYITWNQCCCHVVSRAYSGLGIEQNIIGACNRCHMLMDSTERKTMIPIAKDYLRSKYENWTEESVKYRR